MVSKFVTAWTWVMYTFSYTFVSFNVLLISNLYSAILLAILQSKHGAD